MERPGGMTPRRTTSISFALLLGLAACGSSGSGEASPDDAAPVGADAPDAEAPGDAGAEPTEAPVDDGGEPVEDGGGGDVFAPGGTGTATVTFTNDDRVVEFALEECQTSNTAPGSFEDGGGAEGAFTSYGTADDGSEAQLSVLVGADGSYINMSFLDVDGQSLQIVEGMTYAVDGATVTGETNADIYETFDETEDNPISFEINC